MYTFLVIVITLIAVLLSLVVLLQSGKGGGLAGIASGGATTQILGARQAPDILEKATWVLVSLFMVLCILTNFAIDRADTTDSVIQQQGQRSQQAAPVLPAPGEQPEAEPGATPAPAQPAPSTPNPAAPSPSNPAGEQ